MNWPWKAPVSETEKWMAGELGKLESGEELDPPWVAFPNQEPWWGGWRQGGGEWWLDQVWIPFWSRLSRYERVAYVDRWGACPDWREYVLTKWAHDGIRIPLPPEALSEPADTSRGVLLAVFSLDQDAGTMRWYVSIGFPRLGGSDDQVHIAAADFERFCSDLRATAGQGGVAALRSAGEVELALEFGTTEPEGGLEVRCEFTRRRQSGDHRVHVSLCMEFHLDPVPAQQLLAAFLSLQEDLRFCGTPRPPETELQ